MGMNRFDRIDALRAVAMLWMTVYHFVFDLNHLRLIEADFYRDPFWTLQRSAIVGLFLFCAGLGQAVAMHQGVNAARFWRRWGQVAACALLVSLGSALMFPNSFIYFGVLHGVAAMLVLLRLVGRWPAGALLAVMALCLALPTLAGAAIAQWPVLEVFNSRALNWLGLISRKPVTQDYVPLLPWLAVVCAGLLAGRWSLARQGWGLAGQLPRALGPLAVLGRWSLSYYMLHQPVMLAVLYGWVALARS